MMPSPIRKDWIAYDLRSAAIHEVGHAVVADNVGVEAVGVYLNFHAEADPDVSRLVTGYLDGNRGVYTETRTGFDIDGVEVKARLDVGAKVIEHRNIAKNAGA